MGCLQSEEREEFVILPVMRLSSQKAVASFSIGEKRVLDKEPMYRPHRKQGDHCVLAPAEDDIEPQLALMLEPLTAMVSLFLIVAAAPGAGRIFITILDLVINWKDDKDKQREQKQGRQ